MSGIDQRSFPVLDTMRAVGALAVVSTHCAFSAGAYSQWGALGRALARMDAGVALFFVLSGFLLSRHWLTRGLAGESRPSLRHYAWKRLLRIYPVYVVCAVLSLILVPGNADLGALDWLTTFALAGIYVADSLPFGLTQTWSLCTEVAFYAVLPLLMWLAVGRRRLSVRRVLWVLAALAVLNLLWLLRLADAVPSGTGQPREWLPSYLIWFAIGIGLSLVELAPARLPRAHGALRSLAASPGACWAGAVGLFLVAGTSVAGPTALVPATPAELVTKNLLYAAAATLVVVPGIFGLEDSRYGRLMSHPAARHLGHISYSVFLIHMPLLELVMALTDYPLFGGHFLQIWGLTLALTLVAAEVLYRVVERPAMRFKVREREGSIDSLGPEEPTQATAIPSAASTR